VKDMVNIRSALSLTPNPVAVLGCNDGKEKNAMIASWITQVSFDPPQILVAVHPARRTHKIIENSKAFTINLLAQGQEGRIGRFKLKGKMRQEKFNGLEIKMDDNNQPYLPDSAAVLLCKLVNVFKAGDHTLFVGEVVGGFETGAAPLTTTSMGISYSGQK